MTHVYLTIDTEYSSGLVTDLSNADRLENFARSIACLTPEGPTGITHKLDLFERHGIKAVFFVDPMPAMIWGVAAIEDVVAPILEAGQDVQLHCHTEWLALAGDASPLASKRTGVFLHEFAYEDQCEILTYARDTLIAAGAPAPIAFRAGNYGANDETLHALGTIGVRYDTSYCPALPDGHCQISLTPDILDPLHHEGVIEVPVGSIGEIGGGQRHAQVTALTLAEMRAAVRHARDTGRPSFTFVTHSFELINRRNLAVNRIVRRRFEGLCRSLATIRQISTANYRDTPPRTADDPAESEPLPPSTLRTTMRYAEQLVSNTLYGAL